MTHDLTITIISADKGPWYADLLGCCCTGLGDARQQQHSPAVSVGAWQPLSSAFNWIESDWIDGLWSPAERSVPSRVVSCNVFRARDQPLSPRQTDRPTDICRAIKWDWMIVAVAVAFHHSDRTTLWSRTFYFFFFPPQLLWWWQKSDHMIWHQYVHVYLNWIGCTRYNIIKHKLWQARDWSMSNWIHRNFHLPITTTARDERQTSQVSLTCPLRSSTGDGWVGGLWTADRESDVITSNWFIIWRNDRVICLTIDLLFINVNLCIYCIRSCLVVCRQLTFG